MEQTSKTGLVVEGGGMKCVYSAGILDAFLDEQISFDYQSGVNSNTSALDETMQQQTLVQFEKNIVQIAVVNLKDLDIPPQKIEAEVNMQEDNSIQIDCINIWLDSSYQSREKAAADQLHSVFGYKTQLLFHYGEEPT